MPKVCGIFEFESSDFFTKEYSLDRTDEKLKIVAEATLTNRTELFRKFGVLSSEQKEFTDERLIINAFDKWGENCTDHLIGDFVFAIWDPRNKKLFCSRDHFGTNTLFYFQDNERFIFASEPQQIFEIGNIERKLNKHKLASILLPEPHTYLTDQSWFKDILPFPAATNFTVDSNGVRSRNYWKPTQQVTLKNNDAEILEEFREIFFEIIDSYLNNDSSIISLLSGGLDSSSIVSVASLILEKQNRELDVFAGVLANENDPQFSDERFYIDQFKTFPNININYVSISEAGPFDELETFFDNYDSPIITSRNYLYREFHRKAETFGARTLLDGSFGETGATFHGDGFFAEMVAKLKWKTLWRELNLRKDIYDDSVKYNFRANTLNPLLPQFLINLRSGKTKGELNFNKYHPLKQDFASSLLKDVDFEEFLPKRTSPDTQTNQINEMAFVQKKLADIPSSRFGHNSVDLRYPFLDKRLIEFTLAVPTNLKVRDGYYRYLIRAALNGILPPKIQWRTSKTPFSPDYVRRFNSQIGAIKSFLANISSNDSICTIIDIEKIQQWADLPFDDTERYTTNEMIAREQIPQAIYLIYFLRTFPEFRN